MRGGRKKVRSGLPRRLHTRGNTATSINRYPYMIKFNSDPSLKNCAHYGTLEGGRVRPRIYGNPAEYANRPNFSGSKKPTYDRNLEETAYVVCSRYRCNRIMPKDKI